MPTPEYSSVYGIGGKKVYTPNNPEGEFDPGYDQMAYGRLRDQAMSQAAMNRLRTSQTDAAQLQGQQLAHDKWRTEYLGGNDMAQFNAALGFDRDRWQGGRDDRRYEFDKGLSYQSGYDDKYFGHHMGLARLNDAGQTTRAQITDAGLTTRAGIESGDKRYAADAGVQTARAQFEPDRLRAAAEAALTEQRTAEARQSNEMNAWRNEQLRQRMAGEGGFDAADPRDLYLLTGPEGVLAGQERQAGQAQVRFNQALEATQRAMQIGDMGTARAQAQVAADADPNDAFHTSDDILRRYQPDPAAVSYATLPPVARARIDMVKRRLEEEEINSIQALGEVKAVIADMMPGASPAIVTDLAAQMLGGAEAIMERAPGEAASAWNYLTPWAWGALAPVTVPVSYALQDTWTKRRLAREAASAALNRLPTE